MSKFLQQAQLELHQFKKQIVRELRDRLENSQRKAAALELFLDDARDHGIDVDNPANLPLLARAWQLMQLSNGASRTRNDDFDNSDGPEDLVQFYVC